MKSMHDGIAIGTTLGILAGGRGTRLGGIDKAWLRRDGIPQVVRIARRFVAEVDATLVSANRDLERHAHHGLVAIADTVPDAGPIGGLHALAHACLTTWLLTVPVDLVGVNECLLQTLRAHADGQGAFAVDDDGPQPLVALWRIQSLRGATSSAMAAGEYSVQGLQQVLGMHPVRFTGVRFGNLNTPSDLLAAGLE
jgi:molybdopterin-guanine dinucleotide biosynthesis protein A